MATEAIDCGGCAPPVLCTATESQRTPTPQPMGTAPKDGTIVRLLVRFTEGAFEDVEPGVATWTIGQNGADHHPEDDEWLFAGWNWEQDCFTQGEGEPVGWLPLHGELTAAQEAAPRRDAMVIKLLVAGGFVTQAKVDEAIKIATEVWPTPPAHDATD